MKLTPEQINDGWIEWNGGECPIKDERTQIAVMLDGGRLPLSKRCAKYWIWEHKGCSSNIIAYRIIEAHGADAAPARPTPYPAGYDDLVFDPAGWSQTIIVDGKRPEWLRDDDRVCTAFRWGKFGAAEWGREFAIRVRRREPKRETVGGALYIDGPFPKMRATIDLIDGKPDISTLKVAEDAL